jgi:hypothetical protein
MSIISILAITVVAVFCLPVSATIINIPDDYPTIQQGIDASYDGDTVLVQPGTYVENINFNGHNIVLGSLFLTTGDTSHISQTVIDGDSSGSVVTFGGNENSTANITGLTLQNGSNDFGGGIRCPGSSSPLIKNNVIVGNWAEWGGGGIYFESNISMVRRNIIYDNFTYGYGGGVLCLYNSNPTLINNTFSNNFAFWGGGICCMHTSYPIITNTIFWGDSAFADGDEVFGDDASWPTFTYCDIKNNIWPGEGNIDADPMFLDPVNGDFNLITGSPCIDAGDPDTPLDPDNTRADMGALYHNQQVDIKGNDKLLTEISLSQNFPNPFNNSTVIRYKLTQKSQVTIEIYDILGRKVALMIDEQQPAGYHQAVWRDDGYSSGIYFYKLQAGDYVEMKKMTLVK